MDQAYLYNGSLTAEQFHFYEIRIAAKYYIDGKTIEEAIEIIKKDNLFQYPTERQVSRLARACYKRLDALNNEQLVHELAFAPSEIAKQINLYAIMKYNRLVWEFMIQVIGEKYSNQDFSFSRKDLNAFFTRLQAQNDSVSAWSENTVNKIKSVLVRMLVETEYLDGIRSTTLNPVFLCEELEEGIRANNDYEALPAFNSFR
ncbi:DUF1819 family protein [Pseudoflavonifractor sp. An184]|uniref:DUF1819 family protein n=1 Tax=Pseudoflavonifractor sp. An184 TaxID=1965576 RepID=UPI000B398873|nr:DUF1819 family protein [Pseudoflavonifractor sp. An184]OUP58223.1 hypothetical protein B5F19_02700 [Pseudoflavonifractor sp. An184]